MSIVIGGGRPTDGYKLADGTVVASVTEVIGKFKNASPLIAWAWKLGREGKDHSVEMKAAGAWGSAVHDALEAIVSGAEGVVTVSTPLNAVEAAAGAMRDVLVSKLAKLATHVEVPLVSEGHRFGGTFDFIADGAICDWKTGKAIYIEYLVQMGAYKILCDENNIHTDRAIIISIKKKATETGFAGTGEVEICQIGASDLEIASQCFLNLLDTRNKYEQLQSVIRPVRARGQRKQRNPAGKVLPAKRR